MFDRRQFRQRYEAGFALGNLGVGAGRDDRRTGLAQRVRLRNIQRARDSDDEIALRHGAAGNPDGRRGDNGAGALVDNDAGGGVRNHFDSFEPGDEIHGKPFQPLGNAHADRSRVNGLSGVGERLVDRLGESCGHGETRLAQEQLDDIVMHDGGRDFTFDNRAADNGAHGGMILGYARPAATRRAGAETAYGQRPLGDGIDVVVSTQQRRLQEHAPLQRLGIPHRRDLHIESSARLGEGRNIRSDQNNAHVLRREGCSRHGDAITLKNIGDGLLRVNRIFVALTGEAHHQTVTDKLIVPGTGDHHQVAHLHAARQRVGRDPERRQQSKQPGNLPDSRFKPGNPESESDAR